MRRTVPVSITMALVLVAACGDQDDTSATTSTTVPSTTVPPTTVPPTTVPSTTVSPTTTPTTLPPPLGAELAGRWAHYDVVAYEDDTFRTQIISYGFNDFSVQEGRIVDQASFCFSEQRTDAPIETFLSDAATQAIQPPPTPVAISERDGVLVLERPPTPTPVGIRLDDPFTEQLPTDPDDPRIVDDDGDGNPGITVTIRVSEDLEGELYIARREIFGYGASLVDPDRLVGEVVDESEQLVIGASDPIFATAGNAWEQHPDLSNSPVILERVDESWDCERLAAEYEDLFPEPPPIDW